MLSRIAEISYTRRRYVVAGWIVLVVALVGVSGATGNSFSTEFKLPGSESQEATELLARSGFADRAGVQAQVVFQAEQGVDDPAVRAGVEGLLDRIRGAVTDVEVLSPYASGGERQIAPDRTIAYAELNFPDRPYDEVAARGTEIMALRDEADIPGVRVELGGDIFLTQEFGASEALGFLAAMVILLIAFGSVLAMGLPLLTAAFGILCGSAVVILASHVIEMPDFTSQTAAMIGIGVGIDYALFIVSRYRQGLGDGLAPHDAVVLAISTAGRAVLFAGTTVVISLMGLTVMGLDLIRGVGVACSVAVLMTMLASITLLPAVLGFVGHNIDRLGLPHRNRGERGAEPSVWFRWSRVVQRHPVPAATAGLAILLALAAPVLSMRLGFGDAGTRPAGDTTREAYDLLSEGFGPGFNGPLLLAAEVPGGASDLAALGRLSERLNQTPGVAFASAPMQDEAGNVALIQLFPTTSPQDVATSDLLDRLRTEVVPAAVEGSTAVVMVGGQSAAAEDFTAYTAERLPWFMALVLGLSFLLLLVVFRSVLVPVKAVIMNLLSIGAAYGVVVAVFQWGWGASLLGIGEGPVEAWAPMMLFAIVFGLSMDYEVFLLSRIREEYDRTGDNRVAVADGLAATARVITAAAAIMVCVFASFVLGPDRSIKLFGLGLAVAVLIDATIVRLVLVPATMELLGDRNWWLPRWLARVLPAVRVDGADATASPSHGPVPRTAPDEDPTPSGREPVGPRW